MAKKNIKRANESNSSNTAKRASVVGKLAVIVLVCIIIAIIAVVIYDMVGVGMDFDSAMSHIKELASQVWVWGTSAVAFLGGCISWGTVQIAAILSSSNNFVGELKKVNNDVSAMKDACTDLVVQFKEDFNSKQDSVIKKEDALIDFCNILIETIMDEEVKAKLIEKLNEIKVIGDSSKEDAIILGEKIEETLKEENNNEMKGE